MDDPWANAWGEPSKPDPPTISVTKQPSWSLPSTVQGNDQEADIGMPSWATGAGVQWDEPSTVETSLWSQPVDSAKPWAPSPYEHIPLGKSPATDDADTFRLPPSSSGGSRPTTPALPVASPQIREAHSPTLSTEDSESPQISPASAPVAIEPASPVIPSSPDPFGTFASAEGNPSADPWTPSTATFPSEVSEENAWGSAWEAPRTEEDPDDSDDQQKVDEWEQARQQKEKLDRQVPPDLLASILADWEALAQDLWPENAKEHPEEPSWAKELRGIEDVDGVETIAYRFIPQGLTLPPAMQFKQTAIAKSMIEALRLTRNLPLTSQSPLAHYMASKGSTAWETSIKSKTEAVQDDSPVGWRLLEKEQTSPSIGDGRKGNKTGGRLLSFWGRSATSASSADTKPEVSVSPVAIANVQSSGESNGSGRTSADVRALPTMTFDSKGPSPVPSTSSTPVVSATASPFPTASNSQVDLPSAPTPPPSAVSRFLGRWSRTKSSTSSSNSRNSLALSTDDLEFLSDIVPAAGDESVDKNFQLEALSSMIESSPLPTKLPPPLAPPPKAPPMLPSQVLASNRSSGGAGASSTGLFSLYDPPLASTIQTDETVKSPSPFDSLFDSSGVGISSPTQHAQSTLSGDFSSLFDSLPQANTKSVPPTPASLSPPASLGSSPIYPSQGSRTPALPTQPPTIGKATQRNGAISPSTFSPPSTPREKPLSSFTFPRTPSSHSSQISKSIPPAHTPQAIMSTSRPVSPPLTKLSSFALPPPPVSRFHTPPVRPPSGSASPSNNITPLKQNQTSRQVPSTPAPAAQAPAFSNHYDDDDDFADFHSSPGQSFTKTAPLFDTSFTSSTSSTQGLFGGNSSSTAKMAFDDFDEFVSSAIHTPSPPRPPAKPPVGAKHKPMPSIVIGDTSPTKTAGRRSSRAAEHMRTQSLVESAAARKGQWPAPPSPLPEALPPPGARAPNSFDFFGEANGGGASTMQREQANAFAGLTSSVSSPVVMGNPALGAMGGSAFPPPPNFKLAPVAAPSLRPHTPSQPPGIQMPAFQMSAPSPSATSPMGQGGLTAQDLSFFEGL